MKVGYQTATGSVPSKASAPVPQGAPNCMGRCYLPRTSAPDFLPGGSRPKANLDSRTDRREMRPFRSIRIPANRRGVQPSRSARQTWLLNPSKIKPNQTKSNQSKVKKSKQVARRLPESSIKHPESSLRDNLTNLNFLKLR